MDTPRHDILSTLALVEAFDLPHPAAALLRAFILEALDEDRAIEYVLSRIGSTEEARRLVSDWVYIIESFINGVELQAPDKAAARQIVARDGNVCCVSGLRGSFWDPLIIAPVLRLPANWLKDQDRLFPILSAFFGPPYLDWWLETIKWPDYIPAQSSHWLVRRSIAAAFNRGQIRLDRQQPSMVEYRVDIVSITFHDPIQLKGNLALLGDHSRVGIDKVDPRFVGTHARFCKSIQLINLFKTMAPELQIRNHGPPTTAPVATSAATTPVATPTARTPTATPTATTPVATTSALGVRTSPQRPFSLATLFSRSFFFLWRLIPQSLRFAAYGKLMRFGIYWYGHTGASGYVAKLPFGLFLKQGGDIACAENEFHALGVVAKYTTVPVPRQLDFAAEPVSARPELPRFRGSYMLTSELPGVALSLCMDAISDADYHRIQLQLQEYISQIRDIPQTVNPDFAICDTRGEACQDPRIQDFKPIGPYKDEAAFSQNLRFPDDPRRRGHKIVFTHADLNPRNIIVNQVKDATGTLRWDVSGIVDWEAAGHYPEYWDCTKSMYEGFRWPRRHNDVMKRVFAHFADYSAELKVEKEAWESGDGV